MDSAHWLFRVAALPIIFLIPGCPPPPPAGPLEVRLQAVATGLTAPVVLTHANDDSGRLFVADQIGTIRVLDAQGALQPQPFLDLRAQMVTLNPGYDERGLLGLAFHPRYATNGRFFVYYNPSAGGRVRLSEFRVSAADANLADATTERVLLEITKQQDNHNGGALAFGPDGYLYVSVGDGGGGDDQGLGHTPNLGNGQDRSVLLGKLLRINVDDTGNAAYTVPSDNPFVNTPGARGEIFAYGLRNPWRFSFDVFNGTTRLFVADVGQNQFEEVNLVNKGDNLGWYIREGAHCYDPDDIADAGCMTGVDDSPLVDPIIEYPHTGPSEAISGIAVVGGFVYRGTQIPELSGRYVFADWSSGFLNPAGRLLAATDTNGAWSVEEIRVADRSSGRIERYILSIGRDEENELYVLASQNAGPSGQTGAVYRLLASD